MPEKILPLYGIQPIESKIEVFGDGLINRTWKVTTESNAYILQQINHFIFKRPQDIDRNISKLKDFLKEVAPAYLFVSPTAALNGDTVVQTEAGYFRLTPFVSDSHTLNTLSKPEEAYQAARQFGKFSYLLNDFDVSELDITLDDFHNLRLRAEQFLMAVESGNASRKQMAAELIETTLSYQPIVDTFNHIEDTKAIPRRVIHHDTKISNVLFDSEGKGICVIDLDTVMPGYFISDVGDMMRTYLSPYGEEETDLGKIEVRVDFFRAIYDGYMECMDGVLTDAEKIYFVYAGKFLIYMQALRFLTDYLNDDIYYGQKYEGHNLNRAKNQLTLLQRYIEQEEQFEEIMK